MQRASAPLQQAISRPTVTRGTLRLPIRAQQFSSSPARREPSAQAAPTEAAPAGKLSTVLPVTSDAKLSISSCPEGTVFLGLNYIKAKTDPVALADKEYPEWLWKCLEVTVKAEEEGNADAEAEFCQFAPQTQSICSYQSKS
jgi:large subunit ribosomal protein L54